MTDHFENQWKSILYDTEKRLVKFLLKESENVIAKIDTEIEIELQKGGELSQEIKKEELGQRNVQLKNYLQYRRVKKWNKIKDELHKENKTKESITSTSKQKEGANRDEDQENNKTDSLLKEFQKSDPILINETIDCNLVNGLCVDNVTNNRRYRKKASKTYAEVVSETPNATDSNVEMKDTKTKEVPHKDKEGINLTSIFDNLLRDNSSIPQETLSPPKICIDTSLSGNTSNVLCTSENIDNQDFEFLNILEDLLKSSDNFEKPVERAEGKTNDSIQNKTI